MVERYTYINNCLFNPLLLVKPTNLTISGGDQFNIISQANLTCTAIVWQIDGNNVPVNPGCVLDPFNATSVMLGLNNCTIF